MTGSTAQAVLIPNLDVRCGSKTVLSISKLLLPALKTTVIVGPGGSGKSVFLKSLMKAKNMPLATSQALYLRQDCRWTLEQLRCNLSADRPLFLLDEPERLFLEIEGCEPESVARETRVLLRGKTAIVATHHLLFARVIADFVVFLLDGRVIEKGRADLFFESPRMQRTADYLKYGS